VVVMRDRTAAAAGSGEKPVIIAYSANPAITTHTISACVDAGAAGVLKPQYDIGTASLVNRMVRAAKMGRISSIVGLGGDGAGLPSSPGYEHPDFFSDFTQVVLTPTALSVGGEHEGEKVLTAAVKTHRRGLSGGVSRGPSSGGLGSSSLSREISPNTIDTSFQPDIDAGLPTSNSTTSIFTHTGPSQPPTPSQYPSPEQSHAQLQDLFNSRCAYHPDAGIRRRSVDTGGLALAIKRATKAYESSGGAAGDGPVSIVQKGYRFGSAMPGSEIEKEKVQECTDFAELLGEMYNQATIAIDVHDADYAE
jgi:hypothetical protein